MMSDDFLHYLAAVKMLNSGLFGNDISFAYNYLKFTWALISGEVQLLPGGYIIVVMRVCKQADGYHYFLSSKESLLNQQQHIHYGETVHF
jgi:hypothetical protein